MTLPVFNPKVYCGPHDFIMAHMDYRMNVCMINQSYRDFPKTFKQLATDSEMDDYIGMYLMGGEL